MALRSTILWLTVFAWGCLFRGPLAAQPPRGHETLLPRTTTGFLAVPDVPRFLDAWERTRLAGLRKDPAMKGFVEDMRGRLEDGTVELIWFVGLTPDEIKEAAAGALTVALTREGKDGPAIIILLDIKGRTEKARAVLERCGKRLIARGGRRSEARMGSAAAILYELPRAQGASPLHYTYLIQGDRLVAATSQSAVEGVLRRLAGENRDSLASSPVFQVTTLRAVKETPGSHFHWFLDPLAFWQDMRTLRGDRSRKRPGPLQVLKEDGFDAVKGIGGAGVVGTATHDFFLRAYVHAPPPYRRAMRMASFPNEPATEPPAWAPARVAGFAMLAVKYRQAFDAYGPLFDALYGEGEKGVFEDVLDSTREDPNGPRVDVRKELIDRLRGPLFLLAMPAAGKPANLTLAANVKEEAGLVRAVNRLFEGDEDSRRVAFGDHGLWEIFEQKDPKKLQSKTASPLSSSAVAVNKGCLLLADSAAVLQDIFRKDPPLSEATEFRAIRDELRRVSGEPACLRLFFRLEPNLQVSYQALRSGSADDDTLIARELHSLFRVKSGEKKGAIDGSKLPEFRQVRRHFTGVGGAIGVSLADGWSLVLVVPRAAAQK